MSESAAAALEALDGGVRPDAAKASKTEAPKSPAPRTNPAPVAASRGGRPPSAKSTPEERERWRAAKAKKRSGVRGTGHGGRSADEARPAEKPDETVEAAARVFDPEAEKRTADRRKFFEDQREPILKMFAGIYSKPFDFAAERTGIEKLRLDAKTARERAEGAHLLLMIYCPDWTKHLPLVLFGLSVAGDFGSAWAIYSAEMEKRKAPAPGTTTPRTVAERVAIGPAPTVPVPPGETAPPATPTMG